MQSEWNTSSAYDLSLYDEANQYRSSRPDVVRPEKTRRQTGTVTKAKVSLHEQRAEAEKTKNRLLKLCGVALLILIFVIIGKGIVLMELGDQIQSQQQYYAGLQEENAYLQGILLTTTEDEVERYADANGLCQTQNYQVHQINLTNEDEIIRTALAPSGNVFDFLMEKADSTLSFLCIK